MIGADERHPEILMPLPHQTFSAFHALTGLSRSDRVHRGNMPYERSQALEKRLQDLLGLLRHGRYSAPTLARELDVSQPTIARCLTALRQRGYAIRAAKDQDGWAYRLAASDKTTQHSKGLQ